LEYNLDCYLCC